MPRHDSQLKEFLLTALARGKYLDLLQWSDRDRGVFTLRLVRKKRRRRDGRESPNFEGRDGRESPNFEEFNIFKDWDERKGHVYEPSKSKNRLLVCLKNSSYFKPISVSSYSVTYQFCTASETYERKEQKKEKAKAMRFKELEPDDDIYDDEYLINVLDPKNEEAGVEFMSPFLSEPRDANIYDESEEVGVEFMSPFLFGEFTLYLSEPGEANMYDESEGVGVEFGSPFLSAFLEAVPVARCFTPPSF